MNNFRKHNQGNTPRNSVDGMLSSGNAGSPLQHGSNMRKGNEQSSTLLSRSNLDSFRSSEGFHPSGQPVINTNPSAKRQPRRGPDGVIDMSLPPSPATRPRKHRNWKKISLRSIASVFIVILVAGGFLFGKGYLKLHQIFKGGAEGAAALQDNVDPAKLRGEGDGRVNILLLGKGGDGHTAPDLTDTILVASLDPLNKKAALLSIPRDLWVSPDVGGSMKINAVYATAKSKVLNGKKINNQKEVAEKAGLDAIEKEISNDMGIPIHYRVMVDFNGFKKAIDTVGGIDINVAKENTVYELLWDESTGKHYKLDVKTGQQHFDGQRALFYSRSRHTSPRGDFDRTERQRLVLQALKDKILSAGTFANPTKVSGLLDAFGDHVKSNLSISEVMRLYDIGKTLSNDSIASLGLADPPNNYVITDNVNGLSIVRPRAGLTDFSEIQNYVRNALKDGYIANENATIAIYNGTTKPGLATLKSTELKSYGYNVNTVADAPTKTYTKNILVDLTGGKKKYTRHYLEQRLGVTAVSTLPDSNISNPGNADFVIILGSN